MQALRRWHISMTHLSCVSHVNFTAIAAFKTLIII